MVTISTIFKFVLHVLVFLPALFSKYAISPLMQKLQTKLTMYVFSTQIVFNTAWEDPRVDEQALDLKKGEDVVCIITSAGCNVLALALHGAKHVYSIDKNPCQNALLELKIAAIREFDYPTFWQMFGKGKLDHFSSLWYPRLRQHLSKEARAFWDTHSHYFDGKDLLGRRSFYYRGCGGFLAWFVIKVYIRLFPGLKQHLNDLIHAESIEEQKRIYFTHIEKRLFNPVLMWILGSPTALAILNGVPEAQQNLLTEEGSGFETAAHFIKNSLEEAFTTLPVKDNYFWRVYLEDGEYTPDCCPEYLEEESFEKLKSGLVDNISVHTETIEEFLNHHTIPSKGKSKDQKTEEPKKDITRFILLDHMDWMTEHPKWLESEWNAILEHSGKNCRYLWRSASPSAAFVGETKVTYQGKSTQLKDVLHYHSDKAKQLHKLDRVHTYASFFVTDLKE